jgi:hypothetical protein
MDVTISQLTRATSLSSTDLFLITKNVNGTLTSLSLPASQIISLIAATTGVFVYTPGTGLGSIRPLSGNNTAIGQYSVVEGGYNNNASGLYTSVQGGTNNQALSSWATVGGGNLNLALSGYSVVAGGWSNCATNWASTVGGGYGNVASGTGSSVIGGLNNTASGTYSSILGGQNNSTNGLANTFILGTGLSAVSANFSYVNNLEVNNNGTSYIVMRDANNARWKMYVTTTGIVSAIPA